MAEAIVFASAEPVSEKQLAARLPDGINVALAMSLPLRALRFCGLFPRSRNKVGSRISLSYGLLGIAQLWQQQG